MKRQKTAKVFKIIYFIISALWMAWWGGAVLFAIAGPTEDKIIAFVGWNKIATSVKDKELVVECDFTEGEEVYTVVNISNGKMCFIQSDSPTLCAEIEIFDSEVVKTKSLNRNTSAMAQHFLGETTEQREFYWKLNRKTGILGIYWSNNNQYIGPGSFVNCRKKEKL